MRTLPPLPFLAAVLLAVPAAAPAAKPEPPSTPTVLRIVSNPADAEVFLNGAAVGETPLETQPDQEGTAFVRLRLRDHREWWGSLELVPGATRSLDIQLEPLQAAVLVHVDPAGAAVELDGAHVGNAPVLLPGVAIGKHRLTVSQPGFQSRNVDLDIRNPAPQKIDVSLVTDSATLRVSSDPIGARVFLNGVPRGETPTVLERIPEGTVTLELKADGYQDFRQEMRLAAGDDRALSLALDPKPASLQVVTVPEGARIYLDDAFRGLSPMTFEDIPPGTHRVRIDLAAHDSMARNVVLGRAESAVEEFHLVPNCGSLRVCTSPAGVTVLVDGKIRGTTAAKPDGTDQISEALDIDMVLAGSREVLFTREGYHEQRRTIDVQRDQTATLDIKLRRRFIPDFEVRTAENVYKGVFQSRTAEFLRLETEPGVIRSFPIKSVISSRVLRDDERIEQSP